jgi:DHA1 family bicyclomycin/chloramphenicol resistance-like MFS transporter
MATNLETVSRPALGEREFVVMMAMLQALQALAIDAMLPALGVLANDLGGGHPNYRQLVVGVFLLGAGLGALIPGTLSDRFGRRPVVIASLVIYIATALGCAAVRDFDSLVVLRFIQGVGCSGLAVLPPAIIRDRLEGDRMARLQSLIAVVFMTVPMIAPSLGQAVLLVASWRWIFVLIAVMGVIVLTWAAIRLPETMHPENRQQIQPRAIARNMARVLTTRAAIGYVVGSALVMSAMWGFINSAQQLIAEHFGAGKAFPLIFGGLALAMSIANFGNSRIVERFGARRVSHTALLAYIAISSLQYVTAFSAHEALWQFSLLMGLNMCLMGFIGANFASIALQPFGQIAGAAASVQTFLRMVTASLIGALIGQAYDGTARPLALALLTAGSVTLLAVLFSERGRLFRRLNYPAKPVP